MNFALYANHATNVELCLFDASGNEMARLAVSERTRQIWHVYIPNLQPGQRYGYRVYGNFQPEQGYRYNPSKLLIDPYAKAIAGDIIWDESLYGYEFGKDDLSFSEANSSAYIPKALVIDTAYDWEGDRAPHIPYHQSIIYEAHVKGLTAMNAELPAEIRGTYAGIAHPITIVYLKTLGITALELMSVHHFINDHYLVEQGLSNYWGYNTIGFFAPDSRYSASGTAGEQVREFKDMVKALHRAGIEVILDVVYNHTAEGNHLGPTL